MGQSETFTEGPAHWRPIDMPLVDISSTDVRQKLARGEDLAGLVFEPVARYIASHQLYFHNIP
jgi:nicotinic acid mononucleotide adenylyltransferase